MFRFGNLGESVGERDEMGLAAWLKVKGLWVVASPANEDQRATTE